MHIISFTIFIIIAFVLIASTNSLLHVTNAWILSTTTTARQQQRFDYALTSIVSSVFRSRQHAPTSKLVKKLYQSSESSSSSTTSFSTTSTANTDNTKSEDKVGYTEIIGNGRIGSLLAQGIENCKVLSRTDTIDPTNIGQPIYIATRNDALTNIIDNCPTERKADLVFLQNGYLDALLESKNLMNNTQVLLYLSVPKKGTTPIDGITRLNPNGLTTATGIHATNFQQCLHALDMKCNIVDPIQYRPAMFEKLIWICTYMLVGTAKGCQSVGQAGVEYTELIQSVINELLNAVQYQEPDIVFDSGTIDRLAAYTEVVHDFPCAVKEFEWRNQYFYNLVQHDGSSSSSTTALCPIHNQLLQDCYQQGLLSFELPKQ